MKRRDVGRLESCEERPLVVSTISGQMVKGSHCDVMNRFQTCLGSVIGYGDNARFAFFIGYERNFPIFEGLRIPRTTGETPGDRGELKITKPENRFRYIRAYLLDEPYELLGRVSSFPWC